MKKSYSLAEARDHLAAIVHDLEVSRSIEITRRGHPVAVLLSKREYDRLRAPAKGFWDSYQAYAKKVELAELDIDPSQVFEGLRDLAPGRKVEL